MAGTLEGSFGGAWRCAKAPHRQTMADDGRRERPVTRPPPAGLGPQAASVRSTASARGTGATAPYPVVDSAAHTLA